MQLADHIVSGRISGRMWFYSNYHCNLTCRYCLTESSPSSPKRILPLEQMLDLARQAKDLGFTGLGITGGEPFMIPNIEETIATLSEILPITVLTNGTLFGANRIKKMAILSDKDVRLQISLDSHLPSKNDEMRGPQNFTKVVEAVPKLLKLGLTVKIASTLDETGETTLLREFVTELGISPENHIVRNIVRRGRADLMSMGQDAPFERFPPELTLTIEGAFWSPFGPTYRNGKLQTDLLLCKSISPLTKPVGQMLTIVQGSDQSPEDMEGFV